VDNLQYANSKNLALLKETVMDFVSKNRVEVREKILQGDLSEEVNSELTEQTATNRGYMVF
jgi:hypothetical protein